MYTEINTTFHKKLLKKILNLWKKSVQTFQGHPVYVY